MHLVKREREKEGGFGATRQSSLKSQFVTSSLRWQIGTSSYQPLRRPPCPDVIQQVVEICDHLKISPDCLLLINQLPIKQGVTHATLHLVAIERRVLALALECGGFYLPRGFGVENAQVGMCAYAEVAHLHA